MAYQCVKCSRILPSAGEELIQGCKNCGGKFFYYIQDKKLEELKRKKESPAEIPEDQREKVEKDIREISGITEEDSPIILDLESVRTTGEGKFEIDVVNLLNKKRPLIYKMEEGKYIIDLASNLNKKNKK